MVNAIITVFNIMQSNENIIADGVGMWTCEKCNTIFMKRKNDKE
jgi:rubrerythrin